MHKLFQYWRTFGWSAIMLILFMLPSKSLSMAPSVPFISEAAHVFLFAGFTFFFLWDHTKAKSLPRPLLPAYAKALIYSLLFGIAVEILQVLCRIGRDAELLDVVFDVTGSLFVAGITAIYFLFVHRSRSTD